MTEPATPAVETEDDRVTIKLFVSLISINEDSDGGDPTGDEMFTYAAMVTPGAEYDMVSAFIESAKAEVVGSFENWVVLHGDEVEVSVYIGEIPDRRPALDHSFAASVHTGGLNGAAERQLYALIAKGLLRTADEYLIEFFTNNKI